MHSHNRYKCEYKQSKNKKDKEPSVTDNSNIEVIKALMYSKLFAILNYLSAVKLSSRTWTRCTNARV